MTYMIGKFMHCPITRHVGRLVWVILMNKIDRTFCYTFILQNSEYNKTKPILSRARRSLSQAENPDSFTLFCCSFVNQLEKIGRKMKEKKLQHWTLTSHMSDPYTIVLLVSLL